MKNVLLPILLFSQCFNSQYSLADTFSVAALDWTPFVDNERSDQGISITLLKKAMATQGHDLDIRPMPWARSLVLLNDQKVDILPAIWYTEARDKTMTYSDSYASNRLVFIKRKDDTFEYDGKVGLKGKFIGVVRDYAYTDGFLETAGVNFSEADSFMSNVKKVIGQRVDMTLEDELVAKTIIPKPMMKKLSFTRNALEEKPLYITCNNKNPKCSTIISAFNKGLQVLKDDGTYDQIMSNLSQ